MPTIPSSLSLRRILVIGFWAALLLAIAAAAFGVVKIRREHEREVRRSDELHAILATRIRDTLLSAPAVTDAIAAEIATASNPLQRCASLLDSLLLAHPGIVGAGVAIDPDWALSQPATFPGLTRSSESSRASQLSVHMIRAAEGRSAQRIGISYDHTDRSDSAATWFTRIAVSRAAEWTGPHRGATTPRSVLSFARPINDAEGRFVGVAYAEFAASSLPGCRTLYRTSPQGYSILLREDGTVLIHPRTELMDGRANIRDADVAPNDTLLATVADSVAASSPSGTLTGAYQRLSYRRLEGLGWYVVDVSNITPLWGLAKHPRLALVLVSAFAILLAWGCALLSTRRS